MQRQELKRNSGRNATGHALIVVTQTLTITGEPALDNLLRHFVWADLIEYERAQELFYEKALMCDVKTIKQIKD